MYNKLLFRTDNQESELLVEKNTNGKFNVEILYGNIIELSIEEIEYLLDKMKELNNDWYY